MRGFRRWMVCALLLAQPFGAGCDDEAGERLVVVPSGDVARLYEVVNNADYEGYTVRLEPGTYVLDGDLDPDGWGQLVLQRGMTLQGTNEYRDYQDDEGNPEPDGVWDLWDAEIDEDQFPNPETETIIDASVLEPPDVEIVGCGEEPDRVSANPPALALGANSAVRGITFTGDDGAVFSRGIPPPRPPAAIVGLGDFEQGAGGLEGATTTIEVSDCVFERASTGLALQPSGCASEGLGANGIVARNVFQHNVYGAYIVDLFTQDVHLDVDLANNRVLQNRRGLVAIGGVSSDRCELVVASTGNVYQRNHLTALILYGQSDQPQPRLRKGGLDNRLEWISQRDRVVNNGSPEGWDLFMGGGVVIMGAHPHDDRVTESSGNRAEVSFVETVFAAEEGEGNWVQGTRRGDVTAFGYWALGFLVYQNNTVALQIEGSTSDGVPIWVDHSHPDDPHGTNRVEVVGGSEAVESQNEGIPGVVEFDYGSL